MQPPKSNLIKADRSFETGEDGTVIDHLCGQNEDPLSKPESPLSSRGDEDESNEPDVSLNQADGSWVPDLTMRYPPTFSNKDLIFGVDGGVLVDGQSTSNSYIERPG
jgi:hypothetical protein